MTSDGQAVERLREYLGTLKPETRAMLVVQLERSLLRSEESAGNEFVLQELRRAVRAAAQPVPRIGDAARLFFAPLEPFLINGPSDHKRIGYVARASLEPIWHWIGRDLMPAEVKALSEDIHRALLADDQLKVHQLVRVLQDRAILHIKSALAAVDADEKAQRRFAVRVGMASALEDLTTLLAVLEIRDVLTGLASRLPRHIRSFDSDQVDAVKSQIDAALCEKSLDVATDRKSAALFYGLVMVVNRLAVRWQLIRIATRAADSDDIARIVASPFAQAITIVLNELESTLGEMQLEFRAGRPIISMLKELHDATRGMRAELDLSVDSAWSHQLATIRSEVSNLLKSAIETAPGRIRHLLRPVSAKEIAPGSALDAIEVDEAQSRVEFVVACRKYAAELALSEATTRAYADLTQGLEANTKALLDSLRHAEAGDRPFRQSQVEAAIRFCRTVFGVEYAGLLAKAAEVAVQAAAVERRSVHA
jgi:hypothetical protein